MRLPLRHGWYGVPSSVIAPAPDVQLEFFPVSAAVNRTANDSPALLQPLREGEVDEVPPKPKKAARKEKDKKDAGQASLF